MTNPTTQEHQLVRFEEVTPTHTIVAFFDGHLKHLVAHLQLRLYDGYDDLDEIQFAFLTLPSGQTVTLGQYANSPQVGVDLYVDPKLQDIPVVTFETCEYLSIPRSEVIWFHPDWQGEIDRLYAEHGAIWQSQRYANEKRPESSQGEELPQQNEYEPIDCFSHALKIYTRADYPAYWAMLEHNLGLAYFHRIKGDRRKNLENSITCFNQSLEIFNQYDFPEKWKINHDDLKKSNKFLDSFNSSEKRNLVRDIFEREIPYRNLQHVDLRDTDLREAILIAANLKSARLNNANLSRANLQDSILSSAFVSHGKLMGTNLTRAQLNCARLDFANLTKAILVDTNLKEAFLTNAVFVESNLRNANFSHTNLSNANFSDADLTDADLTNARLGGAYLINSILVGTKLDNAVVRNARFGGENVGLSEFMKQDLISRGAIFDDYSEDRSESKILVPQ